MTAVVERVESALGLLQNETSDAWFEYLESVRNQEDFRYQDVEPWAWSRLQRRLRAIDARRRAIR